MKHAITAIVAAALFVLPAAAPAQWVDQGLHMPEPGDSSHMEAVSDGQGGMIFVWEREVAGVTHIHAQRVDGLGNLLWGSQGVAVCDYEPGEQNDPRIAPDGAGGAYVIWRDTRLANILTVFAQHLDATGQASYADDGMALVTGSGFQCHDLNLSPTADGGVLAAWMIELGSVNQVRVQKLDQSGYDWSYGGMIAHATVANIPYVKIAELRNGTACVVHQETDPVLFGEIYATALDADGALLWGPVLVQGGGSYDTLSDILADEYGGLFVASHNPPGAAYDAFINRVESDGTVADTGGVVVCDEIGSQYSPLLAPAADGVWVGWWDTRDPTEYSIYVQRYSHGLEPQLTTNGRLVAQDSDQRYLMDLASDGDGGAVLCWRDRRWGTTETTYVQRVNTSGYAQWQTGGICLRENELSHRNARIVPDGAGGLLCVFNEQMDGDEYELFVQRVERNGYWGYPAATIQSVTDVPDDQGGQVALSWASSRLDPWPLEDIDYYTLWRALPEAKAAGAKPLADWYDKVGPDRIEEGIYRADDSAEKAATWFLVGTVDAYHLPGYAHLVPTFADSTSGDPADQVFQVIAHGRLPGAYWFSEPVAGRSVDNLAPGMPQQLTGAADYVAGGLWLNWYEVGAPDLSHYSVHRGTAAFFIPDDGNRLAAPADSLFFDGTWDHDHRWYYKVSAVDVHGNNSPYAFLSPNFVSAAGDGATLPTATTLLPNHPNPFNPRTTIRYHLAADGLVRLRVFDAAGRLVRVLVDERQARGRREVSWDGRDGGGRRAASGVYLCRLEAAGVVRNMRMTLLK